MARKRICIISFSQIKQDARVLRQIEYLSPHYDLTVIGYGDAPDISDIDWCLFPHRDTLIAKVIRSGLQVVGQVIPAAYDLLELCRERYWKTRRAIPDTHVILANDLSALPVAAHLARRYGAKLVFDAHEYSPLEQETPKFKRLEMPNRTYLLRRYARRAHASMTVCEPIAERYAEEFGFHPIVVMNAPRMNVQPDHPINPEAIRLIHHGTFQPDRQPELMIHALALADQRFELYFMLIGSDTHLQPLRKLSDEIALGRVHFLSPVPAGQVVRQIAEYDVGFYLLPPTNYNNHVALPNKFFDFIGAGLAVVVGQSPSMAQIVQAYGFGCTAPSFEPQDVADTLNKLTVEDIVTMRTRSHEAARILNADIEMKKLVNLFDHLLGE
jgi:glycosyltransferase involved in cell wall biosynthesis